MGGGGGGLFIYNNSPGTVVHNSIFWGNTTPASGTESIGWYTTSSEPTVTFSDIEGGFTGTGNIDVDPQFVDAAGGDY